MEKPLQHCREGSGGRGFPPPLPAGKASCCSWLRVWDFSSQTSQCPFFEFCWELEVPFTLQRSFCRAWVTSGPAGSPALTGLRSLVPPSSSSSQHILALFLSSCWGCPVPDGFSPACTQLPRGKKSPNSFPCWAGLRTQPQEQHLRGYGWSLPWAPGAGR